MIQQMLDVLPQLLARLLVLCAALWCAAAITWALTPLGEKIEPVTRGESPRRVQTVLVEAEPARKADRLPLALPVVDITPPAKSLSNVKAKAEAKAEAKPHNKRSRHVKRFFRRHHHSQPHAAAAPPDQTGYAWKWLAW